MLSLAVRWSELEARKPYAKPFAVTLEEAANPTPVMVAMNGVDLIYYRQFQKSVLTLSGLLLSDPEIDGAPDPQLVWLDRLQSLLPQVITFRLHPVSEFDPNQGRQFHFELQCEPETAAARVSADALLEYQNFQAELAHQTGHLFRATEIEAIADHAERQKKWTWFLNGLMDMKPVER